ncbi:MAG: DUF5939 domain-containing protein [Myxococcota bacterium]
MPEALLDRHPWPSAWLSKGKPLDFLWRFTIEALPEEIWPLISDTSRLNRAMGVSKMHFVEREGVLYGSARNGGMLQEWVEVPWSWVEGRSITSTRIYSRGFAHLVRAVFELVETGPGRTDFLVYFGWIPRGSWQRMLLSIGMRQLEGEFQKVTAEIGARIRENRALPAPLRISGPPPSSDAVARLRTLAELAIKDGADAEALRRLVEHLSTGDEMDLYRIQILPLARQWGLSPDALLGACLRATRVGMLDLSWDVICPHCRGVRSEVRMLGELPSHDQCQVCGIDFATDTDGAIEVTFHVHPSIRAVEKVYFCSAEPAKKTHIKLQQTLGPGEERSFATRLGPGRYRLRIQGQKNASTLDVEPGVEGNALRWSGEAAPEQGRIAPGPSLTLSNPSAEPKTFVVEGTLWSNDALRPSRLLSFQQFRDLFSSEFLGSDVQLSVGQQTILFTDVVGSTKLYAARGDPGAFVDVKRHFTDIHGPVAQHRGAIVKTIGDAAMAAFPDPADALRAAKAILEKFPAGREDLKIRVRISINCGPCIAVRLNTNIDYFGHTVNVAAKLQAFAEAGQIAFPEGLLRLPGVEEYLTAEGARCAEREYIVPGTEERTKVLRWDVNP